MQDREGNPLLIPWLYDLILWTMSVLVDLFFREVHPRGSWRVPRHGPVMFVVAPHANQFVDPLILMRVLRLEARRRVSNLIAAKSMNRPFIGTMAGAIGSIPVGRALDQVRPGRGTVYLPSPSGDPTSIRGYGTDFERQAEKGGLLVLPTINGTAASAEILEVLGPEALRLKKEFKGAVALRQLTGRAEADDGAEITAVAGDFEGTSYKLAPKVDQTKVYDAVFARLQRGGCVCIFPEGGSHDRTELLPLKPGVAIMALGSLAASPDSGLKIVPCGMNYFHAHKFRSRAVIEFGSPIEVPKELVDMYRNGERREATRQLLEIVYNGLVAVTVTSPDYDTLMLIQATRRLYKPKGKKLPLPKIVELNRRLAKGYSKYKDDPRIMDLKKAVMSYNKQLWLLGVRDHQVEYAQFSIPWVVFILLYRLGKLAVLSLGTLPGLVLFAPVFAASKLISIRKSREALAASTVKLQGRDVVATWKLLVAMGFAPLLYTFYTVCLAYWTHRNRIQGHVPAWVPLWAIVLLGYVVFPAVTFAALRIGEIGMDILKSLRPLALALIPSSANTLSRLRRTRASLSAQVTELINTLGPEMFDDFDHARLIEDPFRAGLIQEPGTPRTPTAGTGAGGSSGGHRRGMSDASDAPPPAGAAGGPPAHEHLPRNESLGNLANIGFFASRPASRNHSRTSSQAGGGGLEGGGLGGGSGGNGLAMTSPTAAAKKDLGDEVSRRIHGAMQARSEERSRRRSAGSWELTGGSESTSATTPGSEEGRKDL